MAKSGENKLIRIEGKEYSSHGIQQTRFDGQWIFCNFMRDPVCWVICSKSMPENEPQLSATESEDTSSCVCQ